ncbi:MAG: hypothetical protein AABO57_20655 [Acidobacteriota bacterium]
MKRSLRTSLAFGLLLVCLPHLESFGYQKAGKRVQTPAVTGTYNYVINSLEVLELPDHKVRISFAGYWPNTKKRAETRNVGSFDETVPLTGRTAIVKIKYGQDPCVIRFEFRSNKVIVTQEESILGCGFGFNVEPDGTYLKTSSKAPSLPPP